MAKKVKVALIADIIASKKLKERAQTQDIHTAFLLIDLITLELQLKTQQTLGEEISLRWGIGVGELTTPIKIKKVSIGTDGPAYWHAREAIESVHEDNDYGLLNEKLKTE